MNEPGKELVTINQKLLEHITSVNIEERKFMVALSIFETYISNAKITQTPHNTGLIGVIADSAIKAAEIFMNRYITMETSSKDES